MITLLINNEMNNNKRMGLNIILLFKYFQGVFISLFTGYRRACMYVCSLEFNNIVTENYFYHNKCY